jgi:hypothetical protein
MNGKGEELMRRMRWRGLAGVTKMPLAAEIDQ